MGALSDAGAEAGSSIESDADARDARAQRRTWVIGGVLLVLSALVVVVLVGTFRLGILPDGRPAWLYSVKDWLWGIGALVLIVGLGRAGSVTGRRPLATTVALLQVIVAAPMTSQWLSNFVLRDPQNLNAQEDSWGAIFMPYYLVVFVLTLAAALMIGLARAVPTPWNWVPLWALGVTMAFGSVSLAGAHALGGFTVAYLPALCTAFLGVVGIVLGVRAGRGVRG